MTQYEFGLHDLTIPMLQWLVAQCDKNLKNSELFYTELGKACSMELRARESGERTPSFCMPIILNDKEGYCAAVQWTSHCMVAANEQGVMVLRNFFFLLVELLFDQIDQGIQNQKSATRH